MIFQTERYRIDIFTDHTFSENSTDNVEQYQSVYLNKSKNGYSTIFGLKVYQGDTVLKSAAVGSCGGTTTPHKNSTIIEDDRIMTCCANTIFCLSLPELNLLWQTKADTGTCFEIFKYQDNYIVHGELEITRIGRDGNIIWQRSGADIFTTLGGKDDFELTDNHILATDWENRKYKFDFNGRLID
jgi:hypothetical protein